jgi:uncharacterized protein YecE (DUF72 family)
LKEYLLGAGGWAYFKIPGLNSLVAYSKVFNFVEVNTTFYEIPAVKTVERWRKLVPDEFKFSVRAHHSITHEDKLSSTTETLETFEKMQQICSILDAEVLHLQTPSTLVITPEIVKNLGDLLDSLNLGKLRLSLEIRSTSKLSPALIKLMENHQIIHCVDLSRGERPAYDSDIIYTRLFGKGKHNIYQPTDEELKEIDNHILFSKAQKAMVSFHFVRMYQDAARLKIYKEKGSFPSLTRSTGLASLEEILKEEAVFPSTKSDFVKTQGWKLFDHTKDEKKRVADVLEMLPDKTYRSLHEITAFLEQFQKQKHSP